jgi:hypothetical protein
LVDFGLARYLGADMDSTPRKLYEENHNIIGTVDWCSQNVHAGIGEHFRSYIALLA